MKRIIAIATGVFLLAMAISLPNDNLRHNAGGFFSQSFSGAKANFCNIVSYGSVSIAASSSAQVDCDAGTTTPIAIFGIQKTDKILMSLASTSPTTGSGLAIQWSAPSTTPGHITLRVYNGTGSAFSWTAIASTSLPYLDSK